MVGVLLTETATESRNARFSVGTLHGKFNKKTGQTSCDFDTERFVLAAQDL